MRNGVIILAAGNQIYGTYALNLALSIKAYDTELPVCVLVDANGRSISHLNEEEKSIFDKVVTCNEADYMVGDVPHYQRLKMCVDIYSPFTEGSLYIDADSILFPDRKCSYLIGELVNKDFVIGMNGFYDVQEHKVKALNYTFWGEPADMVCYHQLTNNLPQSVSGLFWFRKCESTHKLFSTAREVYDDKNAPKTPWRKGWPDEYCFNVAMSILGMSQKYFQPLYFDKVHGTVTKDKMYFDFWGLAVGGIKVEGDLTVLYNRLVNKYNARLERKSPPRHHVDKEKAL